MARNGGDVLDRERNRKMAGSHASEPRTAPWAGAALCLFARYPRPGKGKTRLAQTLGIRQTHLLYRAMLLDSLALFGEIPDLRRLLYLTGCSPEEADRFVVRNRLAPVWHAALQHGPDLGARMWQAVREVGPSAGGVLLLGSDTPHLPAVYIRRALAELVRVPLVLGPSVDGGYYLLGLKAPFEALFTDIDWGTDRVLEQTLSRVGRADYVLLPRWYDIDSEADLERFRSDPSVRPGRLTRLLRSTSSPGASERGTPARRGV